MIKTKRIKAGGWRTVESFWNTTSTAFFLTPNGARIKIRYGSAWVGYDSGGQTLDGHTVKKLSVGMVSLAYARMQVRVSADADVTYDVHPGSVARPSPEFHF